MYFYKLQNLKEIVLALEAGCVLQNHTNSMQIRACNRSSFRVYVLQKGSMWWPVESETIGLGVLEAYGWYIPMPATEISPEQFLTKLHTTKYRDRLGALVYQKGEVTHAALIKTGHADKLKIDFIDICSGLTNKPISEMNQDCLLYLLHSRALYKEEGYKAVKFFLLPEAGDTHQIYSYSNQMWSNFEIANSKQLLNKVYFPDKKGLLDIKVSTDFYNSTLLK